MLNHKNHKKLHVLDSGSGWLAVDKPWGLSVHNHPGFDLISLVKAQILGSPQLMETLKVSNHFYVNPVHRLDKETSGVILLATEPEALAFLSTQFSRGNVSKTYVALVHGTVEGSIIPGKSQSWRFPLSKDAGGRNNPVGSGRTVPCETCFTILKQSCHYTLLEIELKTGRKHQIRRHAKLAGHPVTGDTRYGSKRSVNFLKNMQGYHRLGLHSTRIRIRVPHRIDPAVIHTQGVPDEMTALLNND